MARLVYGMMQSLDGYVDGPEANLVIPGPGPVLFRHFTNQVKREAGALYGSRIYGLMRYWDDDRPEWSDDEREFAAALQATPKWVFSRTLAEVGPNAHLVSGDIEQFVRELKSREEGELEVAGPELAGSLTELGLIDEYRLYLRPYVLGAGKPYFAGARPPLRFVASEQIDDETIQLVYVPAPT